MGNFKFPTRWISRFVMGYMVLAVVWWTVHLWRMNERQFADETALLEAHFKTRERGANLSQLHETIEYQAIVTKYHKSHKMIWGEGSVLLLALAVGIWLINRSANREVSLARQQRNFLLSITHELKSPLAGIRLGFETLGKHQLAREQTNTLCFNGLRETERLQSLVNDLLLAAKLEERWQPDLEEIDLRKIVESVIGQLASRFPEAKIEVDFPANFPAVQADRSGLEAILQNLLENAAKYSGGQPINFSAKNLPNGKTQLAVADLGPGIPDSEKEAVFQRFYRLGNELTRRTPGTGLGLYIVRQLVQGHGGRIWVADNRPSGSIFTAEI